MRIKYYYPNFIKYLSLTFIGSGAGWVYYQVKKTRNVLDNALDTSVLRVKSVSVPRDDSVYSDPKEEFVEVEPSYPYERGSFFQNLGDSLKFSFARRLLRLASGENKLYRLKAVKQLAKIRNLDKWHCSLLANMIDAQTAVGLARSGDVDSRLFMEPPLRYHNYNRDMIINAMRDFLVSLYEETQHPCLGYFLSKVFVYDHDNSHIVDHDSSALELSKFIQVENDVLPKCLESLLHHSSIECYVKNIVELNGLPLLMEVYTRYKDNLDINIKVCQIISHMSTDRTLLKTLHKSGWIGVLYHWMKHDDVRISVPAARALANLDYDDDVRYPCKLYLLNPLIRTYDEHKVDVIFIHGLLGGVFYTWRQRSRMQNSFNLLDLTGKTEPEHILKDYEVVWDDLPIFTNESAEGPYSCPGEQEKVKDAAKNSYTNCWPKDWLPEDCSNLRIIGINYDTNLSMWAPICPTVKVKFSLEERSDYLLQNLLNCGLGDKPIVWVAHSMGGLIVKNMLCKAFQSDDTQVRNICLNTKGIVFYSTPHNGSRLANLNQATALLLWPSVEVQELRENSPKLKIIHEKFLEIVKQIPMKIVTFVETKSTIFTAMKFNFLLVEPKSGNPGVGEYFEIPQDHLGICKPLTRYSFLYQKVVYLLKEIVKNEKSEI